MAERGVEVDHAALEGIEVTHMIHKREFDSSDQPPFQQFAALAG